MTSRKLATLVFSLNAWPAHRHWESQCGIPSTLYISCRPITCQAHAANRCPRRQRQHVTGDRYSPIEWPQRFGSHKWYSQGNSRQLGHIHGRHDNWKQVYQREELKCMLAAKLHLVFRSAVLMLATCWFFLCIDFLMISWYILWAAADKFTFTLEKRHEIRTD